MGAIRAAAMRLLVSGPHPAVLVMSAEPGPANGAQVQVAERGGA